MKLDQHLEKINKTYATVLMNLGSSDRRQTYQAADQYTDEERESGYRRRTDKLRQMIDEFGFPKISLVGERPGHEAWLIAQHSDHNVAFQKYYLSSMNDNMTEAKKEWIAKLEDRIRVNTGQKQLYATQGSAFDDDKNLLLDQVTSASIDELDQLRLSMGLCSISEAIKFRKKYANY